MTNDIFKIGIFSGKGGVGKTSITASIAVLLKKRNLNILTIDTDVDAPNLAILFKAENAPETQFTVQTTEKANFIENRCIHCKKCITENFCHFSALNWNTTINVPIIDNIACEGCGACKLLCPEQAFEINPVDSGNIFHLKSIHDFDVITGETILGSQTSGKLVTELKKYATKISKEKNVEIMVLDGPPGIGCPVIAAMTDLDFIIIVIEPTKAALHDASRLMEVVQNFSIPFGVIINKADMYPDGFQEIMAYINENKIEIIGKINLDDKWPNAIAQGIPIVITEPEGKSAQSLQEIANSIIELISE